MEMKMTIEATHSNGTKKPMHVWVKVSNDLKALHETILKSDKELANSERPWSSHDFDTIEDVEDYYALAYKFHDTADYSDNVDELLVKLENGITITDVYGDYYEYTINE